MPDHDAPTYMPENGDPTMGMLSTPADDTRSLPSTIGRYRIIRLLGEGGMGAVYEAEQENPHRTVALKVIRAGYTSVEMLRRFENEAQALGRLQHPGIAQIYEAGTAETPFGRQPYFAMELVRGQTLLAYCDKHRLSVRQRLELFVNICDAVQHAHQRGLIHRDLKPANILVDESGQPRILDFGLARLTDSDAQATRQTDVGQILGTLAYMSPEQVLGDPEALDTRSDVYALGVILYEMLASKGPYEIGRQIHEAVRTIREQEPSRLSSVNRVYRGDIETIVAKALEKDKTRRYASSAELAADIRRHLHDEPIVARPPTTTYQIQKFARRNKALVTGVAAVFVVLVLGIVASTWQAVKARRAEKKAEQQSAIAQAVNDFLQKDMLGQASAYNQSKPDPNITVRTVLDRAAQNIGGKFTQQPEVEASIRNTIGAAYQDLGVYPQARAQFERALDIDRRVLGEKDPKTLRIMSLLGLLEGLQSQNAQADSLLSQTLEIQRRVLGQENPDSLSTADRLANIYQREGKYAQAEALHGQTLEIQRRVSGSEDPGTLSTMDNLAIDYAKEGKFAQAEPLFSQALEINRRVHGPDHPDTLKYMVNLANVYRGESKYAQAEQVYSQALEVQRRLLGPEHPNTLLTMQNLASVYRLDGKHAQARALSNQTLEIERRVLGPDHQLTLVTMSDLAAEYADEGNNAQSEQLLSQVLEIKRRVLGPDHPDTIATMADLAVTHALMGKYAQFEQLSGQALEIARRVLGPEHPLTLGMLSDFAAMYQQEGKYALAEKYAAEVLAGYRQALGNENPNTMVAAADLTMAYVSQGKFAEAEPLAREAVQTDSKILPNDWQRFRAESLLGASLAGEKKYAEGEPLLVEGYQGMLARKSSMAAPDLYNLKLALKWLAQLYKDSGETAKAAKLSTEREKN